MDILKKMFSKNQEDKKQAQMKDEFRKPTWFEDNDTDDDELFDNKKFVFQMFTNPFEMQKYFDQQMQEILKSLKENEDEIGTIDRQLKDEYLKPGFENNFFREYQKNKKSVDTDLDGEIYADQLHSLLQRLSPDIKSSILPENKSLKVIKSKAKLSDEEKIMATIHGTMIDEEPKIKRKGTIVPKLPPNSGGVFEGTYQSPKIFRQSIMTQTIRKPDGTYETKKIVRDTDGNIKTTITRTIDGKTETIRSYENGGKENSENQHKQQGTETSSYILPSDRNIYLSKCGYALPMNLW